MRAGLGEEVWRERARHLNLEWVDGTPMRNDQRTLIRCLDCGHQWMVFPANIAKGRKSCEPCSRSASRVSSETWIQRLEGVSATWVGETPTNNSDKSKIARCNICQGTWNVDPRRISIGHPRCVGKTQETTLSHDIWIQRAANVGITWLKIPSRSKIRTPARCLACSFEWTPIPDNIRSGSGCPKCALKTPKNTGGKKISSQEGEKRANSAGVRWVEGAPASATMRAAVQCLKCAHEWSPLASNITKGAGCPMCARNAPQPQSVWDERALAVGVRWLEPVTGRHNKSKAQCLECLQEWSPEAGSIASGNGCPLCGMNKARKSRHLGANIWEQRASSRNLEWVETPTNNSSKKLIKCKTCAYQWKVIPSSIQSGAGCPVCHGVLVEDATWEARAAAVHIRWLQIPISARKTTPAECLECGLVWKANPSGITSGSGCPDCAETGYKVGQPGLFYLVERSNSQGRAARKIGITNVSSSKIRLKLWKAQGFELTFQKTHTDGRLILQLEQNLLRWLRHELRLPPYLDKEEMPRGGSTETFSPDEPSHKILVKKIEMEFETISSRIASVSLD